MADFFAKGNKPINGYGSPVYDYSTVAHKTGRKWIDGKDIWEVTVKDVANTATATSGRASCDIQIPLSYSDIVEIAGYVNIRQSGTYVDTIKLYLGWTALGSNGVPVQCVMAFVQNNTMVVVRTQTYGDATFDGAKATVTIKFTKSD